jgi:hypothetical protein
MQTDMHYYATYAMARSAGFREDIARTIATAAEYVDDSDEVKVTTKDGFKIHSEPTAHHPVNLPANIDPADQKRTWVPFHFIPGGKGATLEEKLVCQTDSEIARKVIENTLSSVSLERRFSVPLLGILAHSYVDTFSHYGFSGIASRVNLVDPDSFKFECSTALKAALPTRINDFLAKYAIGPFANSIVRLGHGSVATYPDQPFLTWEFTYSDPKRPSGRRENQKTFLAGCRRLHETFVDARKCFSNAHDEDAAYRSFPEMEAAVKEVLAVEGDDKARTAAWQKVCTAGRVYRTAHPIPAYNPGLFTQDLKALHTYDQKFATTTLVFHFLEAADFHRDFMLNKLLPQYGINIESAPVEWHSKENK